MDLCKTLLFMQTDSRTTQFSFLFLFHFVPVPHPTGHPLRRSMAIVLNCYYFMGTIHRHPLHFICTSPFVRVVLHAVFFFVLFFDFIFSFDFRRICRIANDESTIRFGDLFAFWLCDWRDDWLLIGLLGDGERTVGYSIDSIIPHRACALGVHENLSNNCIVWILAFGRFASKRRR